MRHWAVVVGAERYTAERLFHHDTLTLPVEPGDVTPSEGDSVVLVTEEPDNRAVFGLGVVVGRDDRDTEGPDDPDASQGKTDHTVAVRYTHRLLDSPLLVKNLELNGSFTALSEAAYAAIADQIGTEHAVNAPRRDWLVSLAIPIEASSQAEAVRMFWSYVMQLGPRELPAFVWPSGNELAMQAYVLGEVTELDPEEAGEED